MIASGVILFRTALPVAVRSTSLNASRSIWANILVAMRLADFARQQYEKWESGTVERWKSSAVQLFYLREARWQGGSKEKVARTGEAFL